MAVQPDSEVGKVKVHLEAQRDKYNANHQTVEGLNTAQTGIMGQVRVILQVQAEAAPAGGGGGGTD